MGHEFKPGDLALIINARDPSSIGNVCELVEYAGKCSVHPTEPEYGIGDPNGEPTWLVTDHNGPGYIFQKNLMPLKGDEQPAQVRQAERVS